MSSAYIAVDWERCLQEQHQFVIFGSDKTPMKRSLECRTCSATMGRTAIVAYGDETKSWGAWRRPNLRSLESESESEDS